MGGQSSVRDRRARSLDARYELRNPIGAGGMASVWLATDTRLGREVAVKFLSEQFAEDPDFVARFRREARVAASLQHPNLVAIYDFDADTHPPYLVMEYVPGDNLSQRLADGQEVDVERLAIGLLEALGAIHALGVVHRDIKPHNVLLTPGGEPKLGDFGIALPRESTSITQTGQVLGTARYMAPELLEGEPASPATDIYSTGVLLSECVARSSGASSRVGRAAGRMTAPDPADRPQTTADALEDVAGRAPVVPPPSTQTMPLPAQAPPPPPVRIHRSGPPPLPGGPRAIAIAGVALALVIAAIVMLTAGGGDGELSRGELRDSGLRPAEPGEAKPEKAAKPEKEPKADTSEPTKAAAEPAASGDGVALNEEGFALMQSGDYKGAVAVLRRAVDAFPEGTSDINYAYALYNLGHALRLGGDPEAAIPVLEERLRIPNQTDVVRRELDAARAEAD